jgi:putative hydrolase of the HAD superfamily
MIFRHARLQAVTFDVGGTLIETWPSVGHIYAEVAARHGVPDCPCEVINRQFAAAWRAAKHFNYSRAEWAEIVDAAFHGLADPPPSQTFFAELYERFSEPDAWRIFEDVVPALEALASRGVKLGVISNWDTRLGPLLQRLKLHNYFETVVVSCNVGFPKPAREIFAHAVAKLALPPEAILHVGDSLEMDVQGATGAGLNAVLLQRGGGRQTDGAIGSLLELC